MRATYWLNHWPGGSLSDSLPKKSFGHLSLLFLFKLPNSPTLNHSSNKSSSDMAQQIFFCLSREVYTNQNILSHKLELTHQRGFIRSHSYFVHGVSKKVSFTMSSICRLDSPLTMGSISLKTVFWSFLTKPKQEKTLKYPTLVMIFGLKMVSRGTDMGPKILTKNGCCGAIFSHRHDLGALNPAWS